MPAPLDRSDESVLEIGFDPEAILERDSRVLLDPSFLETLRLELARELDSEETASALLQMGFLHGLQDATRVLAATASARPERRCAALALPLRMPVRTRLARDAPGSLWLEGSWPDHQEASAYLAALGRHSGHVCHLSAGYTSGWLSGTFDVDLLALETSCSVNGDPRCRFTAREASDWRQRGGPGIERGLAALPFEAFRSLVRARFERDGSRMPAEAGAAPVLEPGATAIHVWGPVMVLPYAGPDETLQALDLLARDAGAAEVSVIVVDLGGAIIDEAFGALALEQLVQTAEAWGAEALFVNPSPLSESLVADLDHPPLLVLKDLEPAIALSFQIARSQRRAL